MQVVNEAQGNLSVSGKQEPPEGQLGTSLEIEGPSNLLSTPEGSEDLIFLAYAGHFCSPQVSILVAVKWRGGRR